MEPWLCHNCDYLNADGIKCRSCGQLLSTRRSATDEPRPPRAVGPIALLIAVGALLLGNVVGLATINPTSSFAFPKTWDSRVADIVRFVAQERELAFKHPVEITFLSPADYRALTDAAISDGTGDERAATEAMEGVMRAVGLLTSESSLTEAGADLVGDGTLAFYDFSKKHIVVKGTELTPNVRVTLAHELTHVLQDQYFDLDREFDSDGAASAFKAIVEGDATRIESAYVEQLAEPDKAANAATESALIASDPVGDVPTALVQLFAAPYALGSPFVNFLAAARGNEGINAALRTPPTSEEALFDPFAFLRGEKVKEVATPDVGGGEEKFDSGDFGAVSWFVMLASHVDDRVALQAVDGWGGDSYVSYESGGRACMRVRFAGDTARDVDEMTAALKTWAGAFPDNAAVVSRIGGEVQVSSCDAGESVPAPLPTLETALAVPASRTVFATELLNAKVPEDMVPCTAGKILAAITTPQLVADAMPADFNPAKIGFEAGRACAREKAAQT